jgi:hypothetical protein
MWSLSYTPFHDFYYFGHAEYMIIYIIKHITTHMTTSDGLMIIDMAYGSYLA